MERTSMNIGDAPMADAHCSLEGHTQARLPLLHLQTPTVTSQVAMNASMSSEETVSDSPFGHFDRRELSAARQLRRLRSCEHAPVAPRQPAGTLLIPVSKLDGWDLGLSEQEHWLTQCTKAALRVTRDQTQGAV